MNITAQIIIGILGFLHFYFLVLEMFLWETPKALKTFKQTPEAAKASAVLAANQGLYNGILGAGLFWSLTVSENVLATQSFFLIAVAVAGIYGGFTAVKKVFYVQAFPAVLALILLHFSQG